MAEDMSAVSAVIHISNVSPHTKPEQLRALFEFLGPIKRCELRGEEAFVEYTAVIDAAVGLHLTGTYFIDRAIKVEPVTGFPNEEQHEPITNNPEAAKIVMAVPKSTPGTGGAMPGMPSAMSLPAPMVQQQAEGTLIPKPHNVDPTRVDDIRRTVYVGNIDSITVTAEDLLELFKNCGPINFVRMAGDEKQPTRFAFVEFATYEGANNSLVFNGVTFKDRPLKVNHSKNAIVKAPPKNEESLKKEVEEKMRMVLAMANKIAGGPEPSKDSDKSERRRSRSRDRDRSRRESKRSRSGSRDRRRRRSRSRSKSRRSRSRSRDRSRRDSRRSSSRSRRSKDRDRDRDRRRSGSRGRSDKDKDRKDKDSKSRDKDRDRDRKDKDKDRDRDRDRSDKDKKSDRKDKDKDKADKEKDKAERRIHVQPAAPETSGDAAGKEANGDNSAMSS